MSSLTATSFLLNLPNEIIHHIFTALCPHCSPDVDANTSTLGHLSLSLFTCNQDQRIRALALFCRTSRRLLAIGTPVLYHLVLESSFLRSCTPLFLRTACRRPDLAAHVKHVAINTWVGLSHVQTVRDAIEALCVALPSDWIRYPISYDEDEEADNIRNRHAFMIDLILGFATHLDSLSLRVSAGLCIGKNLPPTIQLNSLKTLHLANSHSSYSFKPQDLEPLLARAPNLEHLGLEMCIAAPRGESFANLKSLKFFTSVLSRGDLKRMTSYCNKLEVFVFHYLQTGRPEHSTPGEIAVPKDIVEELEPCKDTLKHVQVEVGKWGGRLAMNREEMMAALSRFPVLKRLDLDTGHIRRV